MSDNIKREEINFEYKGKAYRLCLCAADVKRIEENGFDFANIDKRFLSYPETFFVEAFNTYHADTPIEERIEIFHELSATDENENPDEVRGIEATLATMAGEAIAEIRAHRGNVKWKVSR